MASVCACVYVRERAKKWMDGWMDGCRGNLHIITITPNTCEQTHTHNITLLHILEHGSAWPSMTPSTQTLATENGMKSRVTSISHTGDILCVEAPSFIWHLGLF